MKNIYVVTHAQSVHHVKNLGGGWYDTSLTEKGLAQAGELAAFLYEQIKQPNAPVYSSDLKRAAETAGAISEIFGSEVILDSRLREMCYGDAEGKPGAWRDKNISPKPSDANRLDHRIFNKSESRRDIGTRVKECFEQIIVKPDENIIVVTHGFTLTFIIMTWLKVPVENMDYCSFQAAPATITLLREDDIFGSRNVVYISKEIDWQNESLRNEVRD